MYRLLIADGNMAVCEALKYLIDWEDYGISSIITADSYTEAANLALDFKPHLMLVDVRLGGNRGSDLVRHLSSLGQKILFCMLASFGDAGLLPASIQAGASDYLLKPVNTVDLRRFLERNRSMGRDPGSDSPVDPVLQLPYTGLSKITNKIILAVKMGYASPLTLSLIADRLEMNGKYIGKVFTRDTGMKFSEYLLAFRMRKARQLLLTTDDKILSIANSVGYGQLNHFYIHFRNYYGVSPGAIRSGGEAPDETQ